MEKLYALHDYDKSKPGMFQIDISEAKKYNEQGYGIHWMPQVFKDGVRKLENLEKIRYWIADIDNGSKETMMKRIHSLPIAPNDIVETKRGFHVYWGAEDATVENYAEIERGIAEYLCADGSLITPTHTLRMPGFYHMKDPKAPFLVRKVYKNNRSGYSEALMMRVFKPSPKPVFNNRLTFADSSIELQEIIKPENWARYLHIDRITEGGRNNELNKIAWRLKALGANADLVLQVLWGINQTISRPLELAEVRNIVRGKFR